jgi:hypothetical protein
MPRIRHAQHIGSPSKDCKIGSLTFYLVIPATELLHETCFSCRITRVKGAESVRGDQPRTLFQGVFYSGCDEFWLNTTNGKVHAARTEVRIRSSCRALADSCAVAGGVGGKGYMSIFFSMFDRIGKHGRDLPVWGLERRAWY